MKKLLMAVALFAAYSWGHWNGWEYHRKNADRLSR